VLVPRRLAGIVDQGPSEAHPFLHAAAELFRVAGLRASRPTAPGPSGTLARISRSGRPACAIEQKADVLPPVSEPSRAGFWKHQRTFGRPGLVDAQVGWRFRDASSPSLAQTGTRIS